MARSVEENIFTMTGMIFCWYSSADKYFPTYHKQNIAITVLKELAA